MIKYHGTPIGGTKYDALKFLNGRNALISFAHPNQTAEVLECCDSFCLDNGAFTIWKTTGGQIDVVKYREWAESLASHPAFDFLLIPDVIMGTEEQNDKLIEEWESDYTSIPVFHLGEPVERFFKLTKNHKKIAFGSTDKWPQNGCKAWWPYMADFMDTVCDSRGVLPVKVHGLRMLDPKIFKHIPLHSGDSTNAAVNAHICMKKGIYPCVERWQGSERIAQRVEAYQSAAVWNREALVEEGLLDE